MSGAAGDGTAARRLVIGIGHPFRGDDGVGPFVAGRLRESAPYGIEARIASGETTELLAAWEDFDDVVLVDAVMTDAAPGTRHTFAADDPRLEQAGAPASSHAAGLAEAIALARALGRLPRRLTIIGIEAATFEQGAPMTPAVRVAAEALAADLGTSGAPPHADATHPQGAHHA